MRPRCRSRSSEPGPTAIRRALGAFLETIICPHFLTIDEPRPTACAGGGSLIRDMRSLPPKCCGQHCSCYRARDRRAGRIDG